jgi:hypothetical protein
VYFLRVKVGSSLRAVLYQNSRKCTYALESWRFLTRIEFANIKLLHRTAEILNFLDVMVTFCGLRWIGLASLRVRSHTRPRPSSHATFCHFLIEIELSDIELLHRTAESTRFLDVIVTFCVLKWVVAYAQSYTRTAESVPTA